MDSFVRDFAFAASFHYSFPVSCFCISIAYGSEVHHPGIFLYFLIYKFIFLVAVAEGMLDMLCV